MEEQTQSAPTLCRKGCGFFGSSATEGMCSQCFRNYQRRKQEQTTGSNTTNTTTASANANQGPANASETPSVSTSISSPLLNSMAVEEGRDYRDGEWGGIAIITVQGGKFLGCFLPTNVFVSVLGLRFSVCTGIVLQLSATWVRVVTYLHTTINVNKDKFMSVDSYCSCIQALSIEMISGKSWSVLCVVHTVTCKKCMLSHSFTFCLCFTS